MFLCFIFLLFGAQATTVRPWHVIYARNPEESARREKKAILTRIDEVVADLNRALEFHELPMKFELKKLYLKKDAPWVADTLSCGARVGTCKEWANEFGRDENARNLDIWSCIFPDSYFEGCGGMAVTPGDVSWVGMGAFLNREKIGILHEIGHNLGCQHQTDYCPSNFEEFATATKKRYQTNMGGGAACPFTVGQTKLEKIRMHLFTDASKSYCEDGVCFKLGAPGFDCVEKMKKEFLRVLKKTGPNKCKSKSESSVFGYCVYKEKKICPATFLKVGHVMDKTSCANLIESSCPTKTFYYDFNRRKCFCCNDIRPRKLTASTTSDLYTVNSQTVLPFSVSDESDSDSTEIQHIIEDESYVARVLERLLGIELGADGDY